MLFLAILLYVDVVIENRFAIVAVGRPHVVLTWCKDTDLSTVEMVSI